MEKWEGAGRQSLDIQDPSRFRLDEYIMKTQLLLLPVILLHCG